MIFPKFQRLARLILFTLLPAFLPASAVQAQNTQIKTQEIQKQAMPGLRSETEAASNKEDDDFGPLQIMESTKPWDVTPFIASRGFWTSNALLANSGEVGDSVWIQSEGVDAGYRITADWQVQGGYSYDRTRYSENPTLDTDGHTVTFSSTYKLPWDFQLTAGIRGNWLDAPHLGTQIYRENNPHATLSHSFSFFDDRLIWYQGYEYDHRFAHPIGFDDNEHTVFMGMAYAWLPNLFSQLDLRQNWQFYDFRPATQPVNGRQEWVSTVTLQTVWQPLAWLQVSGFGTTIYDNSINATFDYKAANLGGEIRAFWKF